MLFIIVFGNNYDYTSAYEYDCFVNDFTLNKMVNNIQKGTLY